MKFPYIILMALALTQCVHGADPTGKVEMQTGLPETPYVGQRVSLKIKIAAPGFSIEGVPVFDLPEISGLLILKLSGPPAISTETMESVPYVTQVHEFALFPQQAKNYEIPTFSIRFSSSAGYGRPVTAFNVKTEPWTFTAQLPRGAEQLGTLISTNRLTMKESWSPDTRSFEVGDAVTRTITLKADDIPGMEFPPLKFPPMDGVGVYPKRPTVTDESHRGSLAGQRIESVTYLFEQPGIYILPGLSLTWWKLDEKSLKREIIEAQTISVTGPMTTAETTAAVPVRRQGTFWIWTSILLIFLTALAAGIASLVHRKMSRRLNQEAELFAQLEATCGTKDYRSIWRALIQWLDHCGPSRDPVLVREWAIKTEDSKLIALIDHLETTLYQHPESTSNSPFPGLLFLKHLRRFRRRQAHASRGRMRSKSLTPLNP